MINTTDLQAFLEKIEGGCLGVDLVKIGQNYAQQQANRKFIFSCFYSFIHSSFHFSVPGTRNVPKYGNLASIGKFRVALDIEQCLDRFYGGYYSGECLNTEKKITENKFNQRLSAFNRLGLRRSVESCISICSIAG